MRWKMKPFSAARAAELTREFGLYSIVAGVLVARGVNKSEEVRRYINPSLAHDWSDPAAIPAMEVIAKRLKVAVEEHKRICIFGDYDVDGIAASAIMSNILHVLGAPSYVVLPRRLGEGYGLSEAALERVFALDPDVLLTVDCGVSGAQEVDLLLKRGIEVLITDHHEASGTLPFGVPIADPKLIPESPAAILAGAGVALKLAALLGQYFGQPDIWKTQIDLAALGTIADCMPLIGENRSLVSAGVKLMNSQPRPGIHALNALTGRAECTLSSEGLSYNLIPRLNAAGRLSDPMIAFDVLCEQDPGKARSLASKLEELNRERKELEGTLLAQAVKQIEPFSPECRSVVVGGEHWHDGVKGIVASRLVSTYGVPAIVFSFENELAVGSGRTVGSIDLHAAVSELSDMLVRFGGHQAALGLTIEKDRMDEFSARLEAVLAKIPSEHFMPAEEIDCQVRFDQLSIEAIDELSILAPFGMENPEPYFISSDLMLTSPRFVGADKRHLSCVLTDGKRDFSAIWFNTPFRSEEELPQTGDVIYRVQVDEWRGRRKVKLLIVDIISGDNKTSDDTYTVDYSEHSRLENLLFSGNHSKLDQELATRISSSTIELHAAQAKCLSMLDQHKHTLAIMATGRGKSLIFHTHAAKIALREQKPSLFIYPLRSLIADQEYFLSGALEKLGLTCASLTGSTSHEERTRIAQGLSEGSLHMVFTTPEFVMANAQKYDFWSTFGFVAIDEVHHIATSSKEFRPHYTNLAALRSLIPDAVFLGLSATSDTATTDAIVASLGIEHIVVDTSKRSNLTLRDMRDSTHQEADLTNIVANSSKSLVYASTRALTIDLCRHLRKELREQARHIAFYNAALTAEDRCAVEKEFRTGGLSCIVATSAFGEGINIPDVRDVILYDMPYSIIDFTQMAGRAGRDGQESFIHILAQSSDIKKMTRSRLEDGETCEDTEQGEIVRNENATTERHLQVFADWLFKASPHRLSSVIQRPLTPLEEQEDE